MRRFSSVKVSLLAATAMTVAVLPLHAQQNDAAPVSNPSELPHIEPGDEVVVVSARRREEDVQSVPVAVSAIPLEMIEATGSYNVAQLTQLTPSVQFFSSNPRNTAITIRGL